MAKLTTKQCEVLAKLADGWELHWVSGTRMNPSAYIVRGHDMANRLTVRLDCLSRFYKLGFVRLISDPGWSWRDATYRITESGRKALSQSQ